MARIRQFKPGFFTDDKVGRLSRDARLFFFGVLSEADDEGRLVDAPKRLAGVIYPFDEDVTPKKIEKWTDELVAQNIVLRYTHEGGRFLYIRKFKDHQKMSHPTPSSLPPPPTPPEPSSGAAPDKLRKGAGGSPEDFAPEGVLVFEGVLEGLSEGVLPDVDKSSSSNSSVGAKAAEEEEPSERATTAVRLLAERRLTARTGPPITNAAAWLRSVGAEIIRDHGDELHALAKQGHPAKVIADRIMPPAVSAYPLAGESRESPFDEAEDDRGHLVAVPRRTG